MTPEEIKSADPNISAALNEIEDFQPESDLEEFVKDLAIAALSSLVEAYVSLQAIRDLHRSYGENGFELCHNCGTAWPCATRNEADKFPK